MPQIVLNFTYGLTDPRFTGPLAVRYIGVTTLPNQRYITHLSCPEHDPFKKNEWVREVKASGFEPGIEIFEVFKTWGNREQMKVEARSHETRWIDRYLALGADLLNGQRADRNGPYELIDWQEELLLFPGADGILVGGEPD